MWEYSTGSDSGEEKSKSGLQGLPDGIAAFTLQAAAQQ